jgi:NADPH-dependent curcumin reductase
MSELVVKQIVLASRPKGLPTRENLRVGEVPMPELPQGGLLLRVLYLSLDPYMRGRMDDRKSYAKPVGLGEVMTGESVCEVIASDQAGYAIGDIVLAQTGWRTHAASAGAALRKLDPTVAPITTGLGVLGMPGFTAYAGLSLIGRPKPGETVEGLLRRRIPQRRCAFFRERSLLFLRRSNAPLQPLASPRGGRKR